MTGPSNARGVDMKMAAMISRSSIDASVAEDELPK